VADIFVSYTSKDREWAFWIGQELLNLGHTPRIHEWEISAGGNIPRWMSERHDSADHILCVVSEAYLKAPYSSWERQAAEWAAASMRPNFALPVKIEECELPTLSAVLKRCDLHGLNEDEARAKFVAFMKPAAPPPGPVAFPGTAKPAGDIAKAPIAFPGGPRALSNIPISVPRFFLGRDEVLAEIKTAFASDRGRVAITALHGMRGVGKTTLAAAYAEFHRGDYRATWWIRAETESTLRADLVGLGVRLGWVAPDAKEEPALATVTDRLRDEGAGILLIFDNAIDADSVEAHFPTGGDAQIIVTSNAHAWRDVATSLPIDTWLPEIGADYLISRTGRTAEREAAVTLSDALGGLPLAHEQAAAYCERLEVPLATYLKRFQAAPVDILDDKRDAPRAYYNRQTVATTFALAIDQASKLHPAAKPLIEYAALLAPGPIPLSLFSETREQFGEPLASALAGDGLDEGVAALRAFALIDRETIPDERDPSITTDCILLHRLVQQVAAARCNAAAHVDIRRKLIEVMASAYPSRVDSDPSTWPRARRLDSIALALVDQETAVPEGAQSAAVYVLNQLAEYRQAALAAYGNAWQLCQRALDIREKMSGPGHPDAALSLNNLGYLLYAQGDFGGARPYFERALAIRKKALGAGHPDTATSLDNLGALLQAQGDLAGARPYVERALAIRETLGPDHPDTASSLHNLGALLHAQGDLAGARSNYERALLIREKAPRPDAAFSLNNLGGLLQAQGDLAGARRNYERALAIREKTLGPGHPDTATSLNNLGGLLRAQDDLIGARPYLERALAIREKALGAGHSDTASSLNDLGALLKAQGDLAGARRNYERALAIREKALGPGHSDTATSLNDLGLLLQEQGNLAAARPYYERALAIYEKALGGAHPSTKTVARNTVGLLEALKRSNEAQALRAKFGLDEATKQSILARAAAWIASLR
jgi:tetratricopeptide (TPR) repeat protein